MQMTNELAVFTNPNRVLLLQTGIEENYLKLISDFLLINRNCKGIYVSSNRSSRDLVDRLRKYDCDLDAKIKAREISIVDLVSRSVGAQEIEGAVYVSSPSELSATQMAIEAAISKLSPEAGNAWLVIDSLPTLLIFNGTGALLNFLHFLIGRLRVLGYTGVILTAEGSLSPRVFSTVAQLCDKVIK